MYINGVDIEYILWGVNSHIINTVISLGAELIMSVHMFYIIPTFIIIITSESLGK